MGAARKLAHLAYVCAVVCAVVWLVMYGVACATVFSREYRAAESRVRSAQYVWDVICNNPTVHVPSLGEEARTCERARAAIDTTTPYNYALARVVDETHSCLLCSCSEVVATLSVLLKWLLVALLASIVTPVGAYKAVRRGMRAWDDRRWRRNPTNRMEKGDADADANAGADDTDSDIDADEREPPQPSGGLLQQLRDAAKRRRLVRSHAD
jgi:hypothetical protein